MKRKKDAIATMSYFPDEILQEIFLRLPKRSLLRFRCVNKSYCALIDSTSFKNMYHELYNINNNTCIIFCEDDQKAIYRISYKSVSSLLPLSKSSISSLFLSSTSTCDSHEIINRMKYPSIFKDFDKVECLSTFNGFRWLRATETSCEEFYIWNSTTNECRKMPMARQVNSDDIRGYGFGYDCKNDDYKMVRIVVNWASECSDVDVYNLGLNSWKTVQSIPSYLYYKGHHGQIFNNALHWIGRTFRQATILLVCFDLVNERFEEVAMPKAHIPYPEEPLEKDMFSLEVEEVEGCLSLVFHVFNVRVDIWMMQEYGVRESWTKSFSISQEGITSSWFAGFIWSFKNNESLWEVDGDLVLYDPNNKIVRRLVLDSDVPS